MIPNWYCYNRGKADDYQLISLDFIKEEIVVLLCNALLHIGHTAKYKADFHFRYTVFHIRWYVQMTKTVGTKKDVLLLNSTSYS